MNDSKKQALILFINVIVRDRCALTTGAIFSVLYSAAKVANVVAAFRFRGHDALDPRRTNHARTRKMDPSLTLCAFDHFRDSFDDVLVLREKFSTSTAKNIVTFLRLLRLVSLFDCSAEVNY